MPKVRDVFEYIDSFAPFDSQCEWDNSGLLVGDAQREVKKIGVVLDITARAVAQAARAGVDLLVSHHPVIFNPISRLDASSPVYLLASSGIAAICAHTSLDAAIGGVNDALARALGFDNPVRLSESSDERIIRCCTVTPAMTPTALARTVCEKLSCAVRLCEGRGMISKVALCGGAGGEYLGFAAANGCDAYITGEIKHHEMLEAKALGITAIDAGHFETENPVVPVLAKQLKDKFGVETVTIGQSSPFITID